MERPRVIDCGVSHSWASPFEVFEYLSDGWRQYVAAHVPKPWREHLVSGTPAPPGRPGTPMTAETPYHHPYGDYLAGSVGADGGHGGADYEVLRAQHLDPVGVELALLSHGSGMLVPGIATTRLSVELVRALNDWTIDRWLPLDDRLRGTILVPTQVPELAAEEIRRVGAHDRMVGVLLASNGLGKPFGHPAYHAIYRAAEELGLTIVLRPGGDAMVETLSYPTAGGLPSTWTEYRSLAPQTLMTHVASLIGQGIPEWHPTLKFLVLGGGVGWITPFLWRFDADYRAFPHDMLWLKERPSSYFWKHFKVGTDPFVLGCSPEQLIRYLEVMPELEDAICYSSGYPDAEYTSWQTVADGLPPSWLPKVMRGNAADLFDRAPAHVASP
jgi:hypothetical protein